MTDTDWNDVLFHSRPYDKILSLRQICHNMITIRQICSKINTNYFSISTKFEFVTTNFILQCSLWVCLSLSFHKYKFVASKAKYHSAVFHCPSLGPTVTHKNRTEYHQTIFQTCSYTRLLPKKIDSH